MNAPLWHLRSLVVIAALGAPGWLYAQGAPAPKKPATPAVTSAADTVRTPRNHVYHFMAQGPGNFTGYLWVPENCAKLRGLLIFSQNVPEQMIAGHSAIRKACADNNLGIFYSAAGFWHGKFGVTKEEKKQQEKEDTLSLESMLTALADKSGYPEVATVPWLPIGESMSFLMVNGLGMGRPNRCIALIYACDISSWIFTQSIPILGLQGTGGEWGQKNGDIRELWRQAGGYNKACENRKKSAPKALITMLVDPCGGHFTCSDPMLDYMATYIDRVTKARLSDDGSASLKSIDVNKGFLAHLPIVGIGEQPIESAQGATDTGRPWFFTREDAEKAQAIARTNWNAATQFPLVQAGEGCTVKPWGWNSVTTVALKTSGEFSFKPFLFDTIPEGFLNAGQPLAKTTQLHKVEWVSGPIAPLGNNRFCVELDRNYKNGKVQVTSSLGVVAEATADIRKSLQPLVVNFSYNTAGTPQTIEFKEIGSVKAGTASVALDAKASSGLPVKFFVEAGPAIIEGNRLVFTQIPLNAKFPLTVTVAAWQWGTCTAPLHQMAITYQAFNIIK